ncbi:glycosyltransferase [Dyella flagellata]|uniref:Biofilm formation protein PslF n=1 Tax=Dyella flagellata TaxID=1867833 RepID=A0ABQ5XCS6_9GAMM|nr:glycosyltransferase [Dyella flagellata]GLQ89448.1 biofilm formation protein PslF [Dyella flagellata]
MRIALLSPLPPVQNGIADYAGHWRAALEARGVEVLTPLASASVDAALAKFDWRKVDVVHAELGGGRSREFLLLEALSKQQPSLPLSATVHDPERLIWRAPQGLAWHRLPRPLPQVAALLGDHRTLARERALAKALHTLVTLTDTGRTTLCERMRLPPERVKVIPHGNASLDFVPPPAEGPLRLLYFGFLYPGKGIEDLLDGLSRCFATAPGLRDQLQLTLAGGSKPQLAFGGDRDYLAELRSRVNRLGLHDAINWRLDLASSDIPTLLQAHHALVLPYRDSRKLALLGRMRGTSGALSWANACGRGALVSDARALAEEVAHGNGVTFPQGNVEALAARLIELARDPQRCRQWAQSAARIGQARRWDAVASQFQAHFESLCRGGMRHAYS